MPYSAAMVLEIRTTGASTNSGGFVTGASGVDYSQQAAAQYALTGVTSSGAGNVVLTASAATDMVGNNAQVISGTNFTTGWFEIASVVAGVSITFNTNAAAASICTGVGANGVINIGGAFAFGGSNEDAFFEEFRPGNNWHLKTGTHTAGAAVTIAAAGGASNPIKGFGYNATRGDITSYSDANRPTIAMGGNIFTTGVNWNESFIQFTGTGISVLAPGSSNQLVGCKVTNSSTSANRNGFNLGATCFLWGCEAVSYRGLAASAGGSAAATIKASYFHDSNIGLSIGTGSQVCLDNIIACNVTSAFNFGSANTAGSTIEGNTLYGAENKLGTGVNMITGNTSIRLTDNILYGFTTGVTHADTQSVGYDEFNNYYNNTNDVSAAGQWQKGAHDTALNPSFTNVAQITGATATTTAGNHLVQAGATFVTAGVTPGRDFLQVVSGTGVTVGIYGIASVDSQTQITTDIAITANATADKVWQITTGRNFSPGVNMKAAGYPGVFPGALTTGYKDIGAAQRQESTSLPGYSRGRVVNAA